MSDDIIIRLRRAYDETGNALLKDALDEIVKLRVGWLDQAARDAMEIVRLEHVIDQT